MARIIVRSATARDRAQLTKFFEHYSTSLAKQRAECYTLHNRTVVAKDGKTIVGTLQWLVKEDPKAGIAEFEEMFVLESYRGKGIASRLVELAISIVKEHFKQLGVKPRRIFLFVSKGNKTARVLYEKFGFRSVAEVGYMGNPREPDLFYSLEL